VPRQPDAHDLGHGRDVAVDREHLLARLGARRRRPAGVRRVDEDEVEVREPGVRVVDDRVRRGRHAGVVGHDDALRAEGAEVQPDRGRAGAAIEGEADRPGAGVGTLQHIVRRHHRGLRLAECALEAFGRDRHEGDLRRVRGRLAEDRDRAGAVAGGLADELVDPLAHLLVDELVGGLGVGIGLGCIGHGSILEWQWQRQTRYCILALSLERPP
jgi:hypothetical protein